MTTELLDNPDLVDPDTEDGRLTHIISKDDEMKGYFFGQEVVALCGYRFVPTRDPSKFPVCQACKDVVSSWLLP